MSWVLVIWFLNGNPFRAHAATLEITPVNSRATCERVLTELRAEEPRFRGLCVEVKP